MPSIAELDAALNQMICDGRHAEGFETFYHDDVEMQENDHPPVRGREANHIREQAFFDTLEHLAITLRCAAVHEEDGVSFAEWIYRARLKSGAERRWSQVHRRRWRDNLIVQERFFYEPAQDTTTPHEA
ncbi:MAG: nuclear transport factor 2 family protein [Myxococcota bacterium]